MLGREKWGEGAGRTVWAFVCEAQVSLEWSLLGGEKGRKVGREDTQGALGRREGPEAINTAG